jgi:hypothetical protein
MGTMPPVMDGAHVTRHGDGVEVGGGVDVGATSVILAATLRAGVGQEPPRPLAPASELWRRWLVAPPLEVVAEVVLLLGMVALSEVVLELVWDLWL